MNPFAFKPVSTTLLLTLLASTLSACGSGGDDNTTELIYEGSTAPATLTSTDQANHYLSSYQAFSSALDNSTDSASSVRTANATALKTLYDLNDQQVGECGGTLSYSGSYDDLYGYMDMDYFADDFCNYDVVLDGYFGLIGYDDDFTMTFNLFSMRDTSNTVNLTVQGEVNYLESLNSTKTTANLILKNNLNDQNLRFENWVETLYTSSFPEELAVSGKLYHPVYGYVTVTTLEAMTTDYYGQADSGKIRLQGDNSTAYITFYASSHLVEVDSDNDGIIDDSQVYNDN
ncbi:hypothetical protein QCB44_08745 [Thiomicrorhabdus sp. zzn3]|uniref:hypothetical protein n=1 Tax=Thiomicrorhabdus sp. zzn3 TaxID=3039775 RepID=UPI0024363DCE|nr:hypothetical protein [Thiomicrorhabdus sp. zzn3]MDG6778791.1 hypothetical protein [Thiomicrorhabdus sp. zzn3]